ncbi:MAG: hypothetical protein MR270_06765 [Erysipelotrichaceae bacterium]|nr:hypothetical protein [Erysipelotrichaceae bacterium]
MKKIIISLSFSLLSLLIFTLLFSVIISSFQYYKQVKISPVLIEILSIVIFALAGFIFGLINKKQGLIGSSIFILVYIIFIIFYYFILKVKEINAINYLYALFKCLSYCIGSVIAVNLKKH